MQPKIDYSRQKTAPRSSPDTGGPGDGNSGDRPLKKKRTAYTLPKKINALFSYFLLAQCGFFRPADCAASENDVKRGTFGPWLADRYHLIRLYFAYPEFRKKDKLKSKKGRFHAQEEDLYLRFLYRRQVLKLPVSQNWLIREFKKIMKRDKPKDWGKYRYSNRWVSQFCIRFYICSRAMTNKKTFSVLERLPEIRKISPLFDLLSALYVRKTTI